MSTIPIRRKRLLGLPVWVLPVLIAVVLLTGWMVLTADDEVETDVIEAGPASAPVYPEPQADLGLPPDPPPGAPLTPGVTAGAPVSAEPSAPPSQAALAAAVDAGAAAGARAALASVADVGRSVREPGLVEGALRGRPVQLTNVRVTEVLSDRAFIVGTGADRVMVIMDPSGGDAPVRAGERVSVSGALETFTPGASQSGAMRDAGQSGYVVATRPGGIVR